MSNSYIIKVNGKFRSNSCKTIIITADSNRHILKTTDGLTYQHFGSEPAVIYVIPHSSGHSVTCRKINRLTDSIDIDLEPTTTLRVKVHNVSTPLTLPEIKDKFISHLDETHRLWQSNGIGLLLDPVFTDSEVPVSYRERMKTYDCDQHSPLTNQIADRDPNFIHIFYVGSINNGEDNGTGWATRSAVPYIVLGFMHAPSLLAHEIGHTIGLVHNDNSSTLCESHIIHNTCNIMQASPRCRSHLTYGQIIQAFVETSSAINDVRISSRNSTFHFPSLPARLNCDQHQFFLPLNFDETADLNQFNAFSAINDFIYSDCEVALTKRADKILYTARNLPGAIEFLELIANEDFSSATHALLALDTPDPIELRQTTASKRATELLRRINGPENIHHKRN